MSTWRGESMALPRIGPMGWWRVLWRGTLWGGLTYGGLLLLLLLRLVEAPIHGQNRPWTPHITQTVCRLTFRIFGMGHSVRGRPMAQHGAMVANHASWVDIFALNACDRVYFVAKSEVAGWPGIGWLARATGTLFIARKGAEAKHHLALFEARLRAGHRLLFFPEGTSTDGLRVLPFKTTLFEAFFTHGLERVMHIQPVSVIYHAPPGADSRLYGWWGDMAFAPHLLALLALPRHGRVEVIFHPEVPVDAFEDRKALARHCERVVRTAIPFAASE